MIQDVKKYIRSYHSYQIRKSVNMKQYGKNHPVGAPESPWEMVSMDFMTNLPSSSLNGLKFNSLMVTMCKMSKMAHLIPTTTTVNAEGVAKLYFENVSRLHGLPNAIISDRDTKFTGAFWRALQKMLGTDLLISTTAYPQTDGQTKRMNRSMLQILCHYVNTNGSDWTQHLPTVEFAINSAVNWSTGKAPFEIVDGYLGHFRPLSLLQMTLHQGLMRFVEND
jgi:hypothetical protein